MGFALYLFQLGNARERGLINWPELEPLYQPGNTIAEGCCIQRVTGFVKSDLLRLRKQREVAARHLLSDWFILRSKLKKHRSRRAVTDKVDRVVPGILAKVVPQVRVSHPRAYLFHLRIVRIENVLLNGETPSHQNECTNAFFHSRQDAAHMRVKTVAHVSDTRRVHVRASSQQIQPASEVDHLLTGHFSRLGSLAKFVFFTNKSWPDVRSIDQ